MCEYKKATTCCLRDKKSRSATHSITDKIESDKISCLLNYTFSNKVQLIATQLNNVRQGRF